jgi:hypothetical protein
VADGPRRIDLSSREIRDFAHTSLGEVVGSAYGRLHKGANTPIGTVPRVRLS